MFKNLLIVIAAGFAILFSPYIEKGAFALDEPFKEDKKEATDTQQPYTSPPPDQQYQEPKQDQQIQSQDIQPSQKTKKTGKEKKLKKSKKKDASNKPYEAPKDTESPKLKPL